jgi:O-antigen ligase
MFEDREAPEGDGLEYSNQAHMALFWAALRMIADAPLTGVGPYNFKDLSTHYSGLGYGLIAHNTYLELAAEVGLPVLLLFLLVALATFRALGAVARARGGPELTELAGWADGLRSGMLGFMVAGAFISAQYEKFFWLTVFLSIVFERMAWRLAAEAGTADPAAAPATTPPGTEPTPVWNAAPTTR